MNYPVNGSEIAVAAGGFNGEGAGNRQDLLTLIGGSSPSVSILLNDPVHPGSLTNAGNYPLCPYNGVYARTSFDVAVGDFDGDGTDDFVVTNNINTPSGPFGLLTVFQNDGPGLFHSPFCGSGQRPNPNFTTDYFVGGYAGAVAVGDFNGDGIPDIVVADPHTSHLTVFLGNGDGSFQAPRHFDAPLSPQLLAVGDFNGDGKADLAVSDRLNVSVLLGNGDGTFQRVPGSFPTDILPPPVPGHLDGLARNWYASTSMAVGDFNGDGKTDLVVTNVETTVTVTADPVRHPFDPVTTINGNVGVLLSSMNIGPWTFQPVRRFGGLVHPTSAVVSDFDGDGVLDLAVTDAGAGALSQTSRGVHVFLGDGQGNFQSSFYDAAFGQTVAVGDFNGDGAPDLALANSSNTMSVLSSVTVLLNQDLPTVSFTGPADGVPGQPRTFALHAFDPSPADRAAGFTYNINWGDGSSTQMVTSGSPNLDHAYTATGSYTVQVTATNMRGITSAPASQTITVTQIMQQGTDMMIGGSPGDNTIELMPGSIIVFLNGVRLGEFTVTGRVTIYGGPANNTIVVDRHISNPITIYGGRGNNVLQGGGGTNLLVGGRGTNTFLDNGGINTIIGGPGGNTLVNAGGQNIFQAPAGAPPPLTVTANNAGKLYGQALPAFTAGYSGFVHGDTPASLAGTLRFTTPAAVSSPVGIYALTPTGLTSPGYTILFVDASLAVAPAPLVITADDKTRPYGVANPAFTASYAGLVLGESPGVLSGTLSFNTPAIPASPPGPYAISSSGLTAGNYAITFRNGTLTVTRATLSASGRTLTPIAGAPFSGVVATFVNADPFGNAGSYTATINWGNSTTSAGTIVDSGGGTFTVSGATTFAAAGSYTVSVQISHRLGYTTTATASSPTHVTSLGIGVQDDQTAHIAFWHGERGQALIGSFNGGPSATGLANWLALSLPRLYGADAGTHNLSGRTNTQVAAFFQSLWAQQHDNPDVQVLATALNVYATTASLGGAQAGAYGFRVTDEGLGASSFNVRNAGGAVGVTNGTILNVYQLLQAVNQRAVGGVLYNGDSHLRGLAEDLFERLNRAGD